VIFQAHINLINIKMSNDILSIVTIMVFIITLCIEPTKQVFSKWKIEYFPANKIIMYKSFTFKIKNLEIPNIPYGISIIQV